MSEPGHEQFTRDAMRRIYLNLLWVSSTGCIAALIWRGWREGLGFALGAGISTVNFRWFHRLVDALGPGRPSRSRAAMAWLMGFRYLLFGVVAYVILNYLRIQPISLVAGLLVVVAAVMLEILYELIYART